MEIQQLKKNLKSIEGEDEDIVRQLAVEKEKNLWFSQIKSAETAVDLVKRYNSFEEQNVEGKIVEDEYYKQHSERRYTEARMIKERYTVPNNECPVPIFPNFLSALDNIFDNLAALNLYQKSSINEMFNYLKKLETELSDRITKLEGMGHGAKEDNKNKRKAVCVAVRNKEGAKKSTEIKYCSYKGYNRNSLTSTILNQACEEHLELVHEEKRIRKAQSKKNNKTRRLCFPVKGVGNSNLEKFLKIHTYYCNVVCPAMAASGMIQQCYIEYKNAHQPLKKVEITLVKKWIAFDGNMQENLLKKLMSFKFTRGLFTALDDDAVLNPDDPNRYVLLIVLIS